MVQSRTDPIDACFDALERAVERDPALSRGLEASREEFTGGNGAPADPAEAALAKRRLLEWFLLEKEHSGADEAQIAALIDRCAGSRGKRTEDVARALAGSHASVFEVAEVEAGGHVKLWDLAGLFECTAIEPHGSGLLERGDLIAGRVFPTSGATYRVSRAAVVWRNPRLLAAIRADLERARSAGASGRKGTLRLRQSDLEAMFHARAMESAADAPEATGGAVPAARAMLADAGVAGEEIDVIFRALSAEKPGEGDLVPGLIAGGRDALARILDELAFETSIDLEAARRSLGAAWEEMHRPRATLPARTADVASAVAEFDRKRSAGASLDETFRDLERDLGLADEPGDDEEDTPAPDFPGVVGAIVEEFLWDEERERGAEIARRDAILRSLGRFGAAIGVFEDLTARELKAFACHWVLEEREITDAEGAERLLEALERFTAWAQETQEAPLHESFAPVGAALRSSLPRLAEANRRCERAQGAEGLEWFDVLAIEGERSLRVRPDGGEELSTAAEPEIVSRLRPGDVLRGRRTSGGDVAIHACFPQEIRDLQRI